jgi:hypothetical protein
MILCPVAIAVGRKKCPVFRICPIKGIIGDYKEDRDRSNFGRDESARFKSHREP